MLLFLLGFVVAVHIDVCTDVGVRVFVAVVVVLTVGVCWC